jgi:superfamily II DNA or RNA helicase
MNLEIGQRVIFRSLHWEVADNASESYVELFGRSRENRGRSVRVILGLEPIGRADVPTVEWTLGEPNWDHTAWKALHDAYRLTLSHGRGHLGSVDWGRLILEPYQLVPLRRIENLPFPRLMLADDTGLGKTAEAGLILFRLMQRRRAERVLILTRARPEPERWQAEMREKFGLEFEVINAGQDYARLRREVPSHLNVFGYVPRLIMSMHFASQRHIVDNLRRDVRWDVAIIDEAHHVAERGSGRKLLAELGQVVAERCEALLLLTATPHDGKGESFASLIRLLDPFAVVDPDRLDPAIVRPLIVRRLKPQVVKADGTRFLRRQIHMLDVEPYRSRAERSLDRGLREYTRLLRRRAQELEAAGERSLAMGATFLETFLRKRLASSAYACEISLRNRLRKVRGEDLPLEAEDTPEDRSQKELQTEAVILPDGRTEDEVLLDLIERAERIPFGQEAKVKALLNLLERELAGEKVIVFTEFLDTLEMLTKVLDQAGYAGQYVEYHGTTPPHEREANRRRFLEDPDVRILLGTDAASEGINLQQGCNALIHMEIPWNPNRYEQRNGRIDRYGQRQRPQVYLLVATKSLEDRVAQVVVQKLEKIAEQVGSVSNVFPIAAKVNVDEFLDEADAEAAAAKAEERFDEAQAQTEAELREQVPEELIRGDVFETQEMAEIEAELEASRTFVPEFDDVQSFLAYFFRIENGKLEPTNEAGVFRVVVPASLQAEVNRDAYPRATFRRDIAVAEELRPEAPPEAWSGPGLVEGPVEGDREGAQRVEFLSPGHPLVRAALRRMRGKVFSPGFHSRVSYRKVPRDIEGGFLFTYAMRFVDGRGEAIEERFETVFVGLDGQVSRDPEADLRRFTHRPPVRNPNVTPREQENVLPRFKAAFETACERAKREVQRRQQIRVQQLMEQQDRIAEDALIRLGRWKQASEERLRHRFSDMPQVQQYDLFGVVSGRLQRFRKEQEQLLKQEEQRRQAIRAMKRVRGDAIDAIGALVLISELN